MCFKEYIAYQCGHRSMEVVRPCPVTTAGHNYPVCGSLASKQHFAETMCAACERQLHSRWVLIREWEHRWLHERGVCGCEVIFPGLLTTPRVIGGNAAGDAQPNPTAPPPSAGPSTPPELQEEGEHSAASSKKKIPAAIAGSSGGQPESSRQGAAEKADASAGDERVPALFTEEVTATGEHHVAIRIPSLYAAEWRADHRRLHEAGKCHCNASFAPFRPQIPDEELTAAERDAVRRWEEDAEKAKGNVTHDSGNGRDSNDQAEADLRRIAEIEKTFGKFALDSETPTVNPPPTSGALAARNQSQSAEARQAQGQGRGRQGHSRQGQRRGTGDTASHQKHLIPAAAVAPPTAYGPPVLATSQQQQQQAYAGNYAPYYHYPFAAAAAAAAGMEPPATMPGYPVYAEHAAVFYSNNNNNNNNPYTSTYYYNPYQPPYNPPYHPYHPFNPAHPTYATHATYTNTIPDGAYHWEAPPQRTPGMPWQTQGPGPYRTPGLAYSYSYSGSGSGSTTPAAYHEYQYQYHHYHQQQQQEQHIERSRSPDSSQSQAGRSPSASPSPSPSSTRAPLCGLPIGAGPEGESHMPSWRHCRLRSASVGGEERGEREDEVEGDEEEEEEGVHRPRRHSTAT